MTNEALPFEGVFFENETTVLGGLTVDTYIDFVPSGPRRKLGKAAWFLGLGTAAASIGGVDMHYASDHPDKVAEVMRDTIGIQATLELEGLKFAFDDKKTQLQEKVFGVDENPLKVAA